MHCSSNAKWTFWRLQQRKLHLDLKGSRGEFSSLQQLYSEQPSKNGKKKTLLKALWTWALTALTCFGCIAFYAYFALHLMHILHMVNSTCVQLRSDASISPRSSLSPSPLALPAQRRTFVCTPRKPGSTNKSIFDQISIFDQYLRRTFVCTPRKQESTNKSIFDQVVSP